MKNVLNLKNRYEFREWLDKNHDIEKECYIELKRGKPKDENIFYYLDAVEEALCYGWIDSTLTVINGKRYQRFSKRTENSNWTELNKERYKRLERLGLMTDYGRDAFKKCKEFIYDQEVINELKRNGAYDNFIKFPILYQKIRISNIVFYRNKDKRIYESALKHLIEMTIKNKMYGEWNDYNRLTNYEE